MVVRCGAISASCIRTRSERSVWWVKRISLPSARSPVGARCNEYGCVHDEKERKGGEPRSRAEQQPAAPGQPAQRCDQAHNSCSHDQNINADATARSEEHTAELKSRE